MKKDTQDLLFKVGVAVAVYYFVAKPLLEKLGLQKSQTAEEADIQQSSLTSPFNPRYYKEQPKPVTIITSKEVAKMAQDLYSSLNRGYLGDDLQTILSTFRKLKYKTQVSYLSDFFSNKYNLDLLDTLRQGVRRTIDRFTPGNRSGLSDSELQTVLSIVKNLK
jgi:hypothetical protein